MIIEGLDGDLNRLPCPLGKAFDDGVGAWAATNDGRFVFSGVVEGIAKFGVAKSADGITLHLIPSDDSVAIEPLPGFKSVTQVITGPFRILEAMLSQQDEEEDEPELLRLAKLGYQVFPLRAGTKDPNGIICPEGHKNASSDPKVVQRWLRELPDANWGLRANHLIIDVDSYALSLEKRPNWPENPEHAGDLANAGGVAITRNGGHHYHFSMPQGKEWGVSSGALAGHVDVRAGGKGYVVIPPSRIDSSPGCPGDGVYRWIEGCELSESPDNLPAPPIWLVELLDNAASNRNSGGGSTVTIEERAQAEPVSDKGVRTWINTSPKHWLRALELLLECGASILHRKWDGTLYLCRPGKTPKDGNSATWDAPKARDTKLGFPRLYVFSSEWSPFEANSSYSTWDLLTMLDSGLSENELEAEYRACLNELRTAYVTESDDPYEEVGNSFGLPGPKPFPQDVLEQIPTNSVIGMFLEHSRRHDHFPQPVFAFSAGLTWLAAIVSRKVRTACGLRTNLYSLNVGGTTCGKNSGMSLIDRLATLSQGSDLPITMEFAFSERGILNQLSRRPAVLAKVDEIGLAWKSVMRPDGSGDSVVKALNKLFTSAGNSYQGSSYADPKFSPLQVVEPCFSLFGAGTPNEFFDNFDPSVFSSGLLPRIIFWFAEKVPRQRIHQEGQPDDRLVEQSRLWRGYNPSIGGDNSFDSWTVEPKADIWQLSMDAIELSHTLSLKFDRLVELGEEAGSTSCKMYSRGGEHIKKIAMLLAINRVGFSPGGGTVEADDIRAASALFEHSATNFINHAQFSISGSRHELIRNRVHRLIEEAQVQPVAWRYLQQRCRSYESRDLEVAIHRLLDEHLILEVAPPARPHGGRPGKFYRSARGLPKPGL
jgi:hypothetical protein